jgi:putative membrane protein
MWWSDGWAGWFGMAMMMLLFWGAIVAVVVLLLRGRAGDHHELPAPRRPNAMEILDERFARGEIDRDEYESRRATLEG